MTEPFLGEVRMLAFDFAPKGWAFCDGQLMSIAQAQPLFSLFGTSYGGDGRTTFGLPDLRGRVAVHTDNAAYYMGNKGGEAAHTLVNNEMPGPGHSHTGQGSNDTATSNLAANMVFGNVPTANAYTKVNPPASIATATISTVGGQAHENMSPYLAVNFCVALVGIFPSRP